MPESQNNDSAKKCTMMMAMIIIKSKAPCKITEITSKNKTLKVLHHHTANDYRTNTSEILDGCYTTIVEIKEAFVKHASEMIVDGNQLNG